MSVTVCCPGCQVACTVAPDNLGQTGRCNTCGLRIRLATPVAVALDCLQPVLQPALQPVLQPIAEEDWPDSPVILDAARPARRPEPARFRSDAARDSARRSPPKALLIVLALVGLLGGGVGGAFLVRSLVAPVEQKFNPNLKE